MQIQEKLKGTGVALVTPFRKNTGIDFKALEKLLKHTTENGVDYLVVLGTTGEAATLSKDEKQAVLNFVIDFADGKYPIVAGLGSNNTNELVSIVQSADFEGIDALLSVAPAYNKPTQKGIYEHYKALATISPKPIILYNVPGRTACNISAETTIKLANDFDNIVAVKEASGNFEQIMKIVKNKPNDFLVISGEDMLALPQFSIGVEGVISVIANVFPKEYSNLINMASQADYKNAMKIQNQLLDIMNTIFVEGNPAGVKAALKILGILEDNLRLPLVPVSMSTYNKLKQQIDTLRA